MKDIRSHLLFRKSGLETGLSMENGRGNLKAETSQHLICGIRGDQPSDCDYTGRAGFRVVHTRLQTPALSLTMTSGKSADLAKLYFLILRDGATYLTWLL